MDLPNEPVSLDRIPTVFAAVVLPRVEQHVRIHFRDLRSADLREEAVAEAVALAWSWCLRLARRGRDAAAFPSAIATFAARAVRSGRRLCGNEKPKDVLSPLAQRNKGFTVGSLSTDVRSGEGLFADALCQNRRTPVPDQVVFRLDFPAWVRTRSRRDRRLIADLMAGERTLDVARRHGVCPARVSQLRRELWADWRRFCEEGPAGPPGPAEAAGYAHEDQGT
jgi:hypothetical protein